MNAKESVKPKICVIIPSLNLVNKLQKCLESIFITSYKNLSIIIIDDGSEYPLEDKLISYKKKFPSLLFLRSEKNKGFAQANNLGLKLGSKRFSDTDYFLLLNNDAYITNDFFTRSLPYLKKNFDLLYPVIMLSNGRGVDSIGIDYFSDSTTLNRVKRSRADCLTPAACLFVSSKFVQECFLKFGWVFIPEFHSYAEDVELSLRAILMKKKLTLIPHGVVSHDKSSSQTDTQNAHYLGTRNLFWTVITTWTDQMIRENIIEIIKGQFKNMFIYSLKYKNTFMLKIYVQTGFYLLKLLETRKLIQKHMRLESPESLFKKNNISLAMHVKRSSSFKKIQNFCRRSL